MFRTDAERKHFRKRLLNEMALEREGDTFTCDEVLEIFDEVAAGGRYDPLTEDEILALFEQGASPEFVMLAQYDDGDRNSVRENANAALEDGRNHFGHFGDYMWEGDLYRAMERADGTNTRILKEVFGLAYINGVARSQTDNETPLRGFEENDSGRVVYK